MSNEQRRPMPSRSNRDAQGRSILLTGATGYVGGRLLPALLERGHRLRCLARRPEAVAADLDSRSQVVKGDAVSGEGLSESLRGIDTAYYLIHSMGGPGGFEDADRRAALNFGSAARAAGVRRIVYLGGLADEAQRLSTHLRSRIEVGQLLRASGVPVIELRASIVIGSGSLSFEMIRSLVEHLPVLVTPRWVSMPAQPIGIDDLISYLVRALDADPSGSPVYEIGGADRMSYRDLMREYARQRRLRRVMIRVPVLTPWLSSLWLGLVTPLYARVGRNIIDSIRHPSVVRDERARHVFEVAPTDIRTAMAQALGSAGPDLERTPAASEAWGLPTARSSIEKAVEPPRLVDSREAFVAAAPAIAFQSIRRIGGERGWYAHDWLWRLRGRLDVVFGGPGMRRGRRDPERIASGDTIDCWRVTGFEPDRFLQLFAEMRLPGRAWLEFEVTPEANGARIRQTAIFEPSGLAGRAYWYGVLPLHALVFGGMLRGLARRARESAAHSRSGSLTPRAVETS
jgi:uncharacterized protein YbjT (DUF2867 family)